jgi:hypothetical protein
VAKLNDNMTKPSYILTIAVALFPAAGLHRAQALTTNLVPVADTDLWQGAPDNNLGHQSYMPIGTSNFGNRGRGLVKFDLSRIPASATVNSATMTLKIVFDHDGSLAIAVHRMLRDWTEGTGIGGPGGGDIGSAAQTGEPTWNNRAHPDMGWGAAGGSAGVDFASAASVSVTPAGAAVTFSSATLTAEVQAFVTDASTNFGWLVKHVNEGTGFNGGRRIATREDSLNTPTLVVDYTVPSPPNPPTIFETTRQGNQILFSFIAEANHGYTVESRDSLTAGDWMPLTSISAQGTNRVVIITNTISSTERYFRVRTP